MWHGSPGLDPCDRGLANPGSRSEFSLRQEAAVPKFLEPNPNDFHLISQRPHSDHEMVHYDLEVISSRRRSGTSVAVADSGPKHQVRRQRASAPAPAFGSGADAVGGGIAEV